MLGLGRLKSWVLCDDDKVKSSLVRICIRLIAPFNDASEGAYI